jgi:hypothetical protein
MGWYTQNKKTVNIIYFSESKSVSFSATISTWNVAESTSDAVVLVVDDEWSAFHDTATVPHLSLAGTEALRRVHLLDVVPGLELLEDLDGVLGVLELLDLVRDDERHLGRLLDTVALGHHQTRNARGRDGGHDRIATLLDVHLAVPAAPRLGRREHAAATAHVAESSLAAAVGATTANTRDTSDGATCAPRLGRRLHAGLLADGERVATVLAHLVVHVGDHVGSDGCAEHGRQKDRALGRLALLIVHVDQRSGCY